MNSQEGGKTGRLSIFLSSCSLSLSLAACGGPTPAQDAGPASWQIVLSNLRATLLCVWGTASDDVFAVGGGLGNAGSPPAFLHYDGTSWKDLGASGTDTFWWVNGTGSKDVWAVGEKGRMTHWDGARFRDETPMTTATLYGVWAAAPNDVWAVGGMPGGTPNDVVLHYDGTSWTPSPPPQTLGRTFFKVWGTAPDNFYVVGEAATVWHRSGSQWILESQPPVARGRLTTVNGCGPHEVYAVGDRDVLRSDGKTWSRVNFPPADNPLPNNVNGVSCASPGHVVVVGSGSLKLRLTGGEWQDDSQDDPHTDLHGAWADPTGAYWAAGGDFGSPPSDAGTSRQGVLAYYGTAPPSSLLAP